MATIPLPALAIHPPEQQSPFDQYGKVVALQNLMQEQQLRQQLAPGAVQQQSQQLQSGALQLEQEKLKVQSQKAIMNAIQEEYSASPSKATQPDEAGEEPAQQEQTLGSGVPAVKTMVATEEAPVSAQPLLSTATADHAPSDFLIGYQRILRNASMNGALPDDILGLSGKLLSQQDTFAKMTKTQQEIAIAQNKNAGELAANILAVTDPGQQASVWKQAQVRLANDRNAVSVYGPDMTQYILNNPYPGPAAITQHLGLIQGRDAMLADEKARLENLGAAQKYGPLGPDTVARTQGEINARLSNLFPGLQQVPKAYSLPPTATQADVDRLDAQLKALESASPGLAARKAGAEAAARVGPAIAEEVGKQKALAIPLHQVARTTIGGQSYIDAEDLPPQSAALMRQQAAAAGVPVVSKDTADVLREIDTAKANQGYMLSVLGSKLAADPTGRLYTAPANTIEKLAQTDPQLAAIGTFRNAAIQSMRAVAGSKGLRMNQALIETAINNDIPKMTDTLPVAQEKLKNLNAFLDNSVAAHLNPNRANMLQAPSAGGGAPATFDWNAHPVVPQH